MITKEHVEQKTTITYECNNCHRNYSSTFAFHKCNFCSEQLCGQCLRKYSEDDWSDRPFVQAYACVMCETKANVAWRELMNEFERIDTLKQEMMDKFCRGEL